MRKLEQLEPHPPFSFFNLGMRAMRDGNFKAARDLFAKEVERAPYYHEFHFWLAAAYVGLGQGEEARKELEQALQKHPTQSQQREIGEALKRVT